MTVEEIRLSHHLTQPEFADAIGISTRTYTNKIKGRNAWTPLELSKIAKFCDEIEIPCENTSLLFKIKPISHNVWISIFFGSIMRIILKG